MRGEVRGGGGRKALWVQVNFPSYLEQQTTLNLGSIRVCVGGGVCEIPPAVLCAACGLRLPGSRARGTQPGASSLLSVPNFSGWVDLSQPRLFPEGYVLGMGPGFSPLPASVSLICRVELISALWI